MNQVGKIGFKKINRISPSQFYSLKNCAYKSILAEAFERKPLLPVSPNAYFGTVLHKMLELISKGIVRNEDEFNGMFDEQVKSMEENLQLQGYGFFLPLQTNVKDFGMKKVLLKRHLRSNAEKSTKPTGIKFYSEKWLESKDKTVAGRIDLIVETEQGAEIIDFKTGAITQDVLDDSGEIFSEVKEEYKDQLKLYAYLYYEQNGKFPTQLSLVDLAKQKFNFTFSPSECVAVFEEAKKLLNALNNNVGSETLTANPSEANCSYCLYRPACSFFLKLLESNNSFNDASGTVKNVIKYQNGNVSVFLENGERQITITGFQSERYDELNAKKDAPISVFNLRKTATQFVFSTTKTTMIYE